MRVFVGYDSEQPLASAVFVHSLLRRSSIPVSVQYLRLGGLSGYFHREREALQSTEFSFTRFLVPALCGYEGRALYFDGDMVMRADVADLAALFDESKAVQVVQRRHHTHTADGRKFLGRAQTEYERKNWSSVVYFNNARCRSLTPQCVETAPGLYLHQFRWLRDEDIGALPPEWNHLVGVDEPSAMAKLVHFTLGTPQLVAPECEYAASWFEERARLLGGA